MGCAIWAAGFGPRAAEMKLGRAGVANRPFAGMLGEMQHAGALLGAQYGLWNNLLFNIVNIVGTKTAMAGRHAWR